MQLQGLAKFLVDSGIINESDAVRYAEQSEKSQNGNFLTELTKDKKYSPKAVAECLSLTTGYPIVDLASLEIDPSFKRKDFNKKLFEEACAIPIFRKNNIFLVGVSDALTEARYKSLKFEYGNIEYVVVEHDKLLDVLKSLQSAKDQVNDLIKGFDLNDAFGEAPVEEEESFNDFDEDDTPVKKLVQQTILSAVELGASDLHFEPYETKYQIRFRIDGELVIHMEPPIHIKDALTNFIKVHSQMDVAEKRIPQDGRMSMHLGARRVDFRVSTCPVVRGEKIVLRILDPSSVQVPIDVLGYEPEQKKLLLDAVERPYGMVLVTGPTGSGKTVSLYTCLNILNTPNRNISTAEDPAEIDLPGINQVNVNVKAGLTFAAALTSFLRQDPDIIMVGEIRDKDTADIAIKASQTGHMVLSTLHTNTAPETITRLLNMGIPAFNVASSLTLVTAQRLGRRLCSCKKEVTIPDAALLEIGFTNEQIRTKGPIYGPVGCDRCRRTGYKGRVGVYQVMPVTDAIKKIILEGGNAMMIAEQAAKDGVNDLRQSGILKILQGLTSVEEILAITNE